MGTIAIERVVAVPPQRLWEVITDWEGYARWMPLTIMRLDPGPTRVGWSFAGLTGIGWLRFCDLMRITHWSPPPGTGPSTGTDSASDSGTGAETGMGRFRLVKVGRLLSGWAEVSVLPLAGGTQTQLLWREEIVLRPVVLGRLLAPLTDRLNQALFSTVIDAMAAEARQACGQG